ncbi:hypothetical protein PHYPSEUDO_008432 [Phytophthora pseudosyringae]|uniref:Secreted protein n=1 Tax=Phytophthora pseudosyringae TaxID=221518 RepID=A0A8T1WDE7_9STRA|nr:hypothetical protein PHYPSEUDO_008432 [Phytophthora pseudosyringae]
MWACAAWMTLINFLVLSALLHARGINCAYVVEYKTDLVGVLKAEYFGDESVRSWWSLWWIRWSFLLEWKRGPGQGEEDICGGNGDINPRCLTAGRWLR